MIDRMDIVTPHAQQHPDQAAAAMARLSDLIATDPALQTAEVGHLLRLVPERRAIVSGWLHGSPAVFRLSLHPDETVGFARQWKELQRAQSFMTTGQNRIAAPLALAAAGQVLVVSLAPGHPMLELVWGLEPPERLGHLQAAANWLSCYQAPTTEHSHILWKGWFKKAEAALARQTHAPLQDMETRVLRRMKALGRRLQEQESWRTAIGHGDFHPNNLIVSEGVLNGIDLGGSSRIPIYKDMARFMTHMARRGVTISGERRFGVDAATYAAFIDAFALDRTEAELCLPFMICFETLIRVEHPDMPEARINHALAMAKALQADIKEIL
jgi:hypothetical protein